MFTLVGAALAATLMLPAVAATSAGAASSSNSRPSKHSKFTLGIVQVAPVTAIIDMTKGEAAEAHKLGMKTLTAAADFTTTKLIEAVQSMISRHVSAILTSALDPTAFESTVVDAEKAHIPVLVYDTPVKGVSVDMSNPDFAETKKSIRIVKAHLASMNQPCDIAIIQGTKKAAPLAHRDEGFLAGAKAYGCTVVATETVNQTTATATATVVNQWKTEYGTKIKAIFPYNDTAALGADSTLGGNFNPVVVGFNGSPQNVAEVASGTQYEDFGLSNVVMGVGLAYAAYRILTGHKVPKSITSPYAIITKANAKKYKGTDFYLKHVPKVTFVHKHKKWLLRTVKHHG